jgi:hypothetical protein
MERENTVTDAQVISSKGFLSIVHRNTSTFDGWVHRLNRTKMDLKKGGLK